MKKMIFIGLVCCSMRAVAQNVGIGETSPTEARLQVRAGDSALLLLHSYPRIPPGNTNPIKTGLFFKTYDNYTGSIATLGLGNFYRLGFFTKAGPSPNILAERMSISDGGNVGIGNTSPSYKLDVAGNFRTTTTAQIGGLLSANNGISVFGSAAVNGNISATGTAKVGGSFSANSILSEGNTTVGANLTVTGQSDFNTIKVTGGSPGVNRVLTAANNNGNVVWANSSIGSVFSTYAEYARVPKGEYSVLPFTTNGAGNFNDEGSYNNTLRRFIAPATGVYHFDLNLEFNTGYGDVYAGYYPDDPGFVSVAARKNGVLSTIYKASEYVNKGSQNETLQPGLGNLNMSFTLKLNLNESVDFVVYQTIVRNTAGTEKNVIAKSFLQGYRIY